jgi:acyl-CoA hydrolase
LGILHETTYNVWLVSLIIASRRIYMNKVVTLFVTLLLISSPAWSGEQVATDKPFMSASQTATMTASVEAINHETREVTLRGPQGNTMSFVASEEARNLDQVSVGDIVIAEYVQSISIEVFAGDGSEPGAGQVSVAGRTEKGEMPGAAVMDAVVITATVEEINIEANTFKLKGPSGEIEEYTARDPENLKKAEVGDIVVITMTEAIALSVEKTSKE